tara:strand:+ start:424 stop:1752 length:1329 start_codon:yes stop_codon:yes gene_type:complete
MEKEEVQVKDVGEINPDIVTPEQKEAAVINEAVDKGEVAEEYKVKEEDGVYKINLDNPPNQPKEVKSKEKSKPSKDAVQKSSSDDSDVHVKEPQNTESVQGVDKSVRSAEEKETVENKEKLLEKTEDSTSDSPLELITDDEKPTDKVEKVAEVETPAEETQTNIQEEPKQLLPENVDKLVKFMEETGGSVEDYVNLNKDLSKMDNTTLLREYYKTTKPHLDVDDVDFLFTKNFAYDEEADDPSEVKAKKLAFKEELYNAQNYFKGAKDKYYADLKLSKQNDIAPEYLEAMEHYKVSQQQTEEHKNLQKTFVDKTNKVFNDEFKGFDFKVGENKYRFKIEDSKKVKDFQSNISNFVNQFLDDKGTVADAKGYHKALFTAQNADKIANHFYEQGRADAVRDAEKKSKNINMNPRQDASSVVTSSGEKIRVVSGDSSDKLRIKWK